MVKPVLLRTGSVTPRAAMLIFASQLSVAALILVKLVTPVITRETIVSAENVISMQIVVLVCVIQLRVKMAFNPGMRVISYNMIFV